MGFDCHEIVAKEKKELDEKIGKLKEFICGDKFETLQDTDQWLLVMQLSAMKQYSSVLKARIERFQ